MNGHRDWEYLASDPRRRQADEEDILDLGDGRRGIPSALLGVLIAFAVVVAGGVWLATSGSSPKAVPSTFATPTGVGLYQPTSVPSASSQPVSAGDPARCPSSLHCDTSRAIPLRMLAVLRRYVPHAVAESGHTVIRTGVPRLWFRQLNAHLGRITILVIVSARNAMRGPPPGALDTVDNASFGYVRQSVRGYLVQVQVNGPRRTRPRLETLRALASDPRLETLP